ncbi:CLUMA_CG017595, isoform A [Clunio marinus]|uniref:CLUMA_CG017595, isoform A n=1 Tax=Clunio marinus TaxID=568069 RepID=A0A1J1IWP3_9DIPT|nr:CLUMA_CG017595, isoform A [Clunio marinus]
MLTIYKKANRHLLDDGRLDHHGIQGGQMTPIYGASGALRGASNSNSPANLHGQPSTLLVVPQPINATKISSGLTNGNGRKYQCKMCPQGKMMEARIIEYPRSSGLEYHHNSPLIDFHLQSGPSVAYTSSHATHTGDKPYKCRNPGCVKAFSQLSNLQSHSRSHQTDKPYKCNSCYKCFADEPSLLEHIPKHKESKHLKTHICQYCGKSYTQETYLQKHMQKHAERTDKRPPITGGRGGHGNANNQGAGGNSNNNNNSNANNDITMNNSVPGMANQEHPYWPKVSPDSAASITNDSHHQLHQHQQHHDFQLVNGHDMQSHQREENIEDLRQNGHISAQSLSLPPASTPSGYDVQSKLTSNSAFTPINSMPPHINIQHHQLSQRPSYIYDAISFQNKNVAQNTGNGFPNQLISLHQIRNYAHQPSGLMAGEHILGVSVGKDKG